MATWYELSTPCLLRLTSFLFWSKLYFYAIEKFPDKNPEWCTRVLTLLHGTVAVIIGWQHCHLNYLGYCMPKNKIWPSQYTLMLWSWGYFAFDLLWCAVYWTKATLVLCHHLAALSSIAVYMQQEVIDCVFACNLVLMEITNPLLQIRWFLKKDGYDKTFIYFLIEMVYLLMFIFLRGVVGTYVVYWAWTTDFFCRELKILSICLYVVSIALIYDAVGYIRYKYIRGLRSGYQHFTALGDSSCLTFNERKPLPPSIR